MSVESVGESSEGRESGDAQDVAVTPHWSRRSRAAPFSHAIKCSQKPQVLAIAAVTMSSSLSADDEDVWNPSIQLMCCPCLAVLTIAADLRAPAAAQGSEGVGRAAAGCERAYASYSPEGPSSSFRTGMSISISSLSTNRITIMLA